MSGLGAVSAGRRRPSIRKSYFLGGIALLTAGLIGGASPAKSAPSAFWPDYYEPAPQPRIVSPPRARISIKYRLPKAEEVATDSRKRQGTLVIAISVETQ